MDVEGAQSGDNPLYLLPDACKFASGLGCFQHAPRPKPEELLAYGADRERLARSALQPSTKVKEKGVMVERRIRRAQELGARATRANLSQRRRPLVRLGQPASGATSSGLGTKPGIVALPQKEVSTLEWTTSVPTIVVLFGKEVETPMTYSGGAPDWAYPAGVSDLPTGGRRAQQVLQQETEVDLGADRYYPLPNLIAGAEVVVGVLEPSEMPKLPRGQGRTLPELRWRPVTEAQGASVPHFVLVLGEGWSFLGALEALDREQDEWILRPIVLWSKSFSGAQINWTTWEQELFTIKEFSWVWSTMVSGMWCVVVPDCLNNLTIMSNAPIRNPGKILRWFEEILGRMHTVWAFGPGVVNRVGDFLSRNPRDREAVRGPDPEDGPEEKTTLEQVIEMVGLRQIARDEALKGLAVGPVRWMRDPEKVPQKAVTDLPTIRPQYEDTLIRGCTQPRGGEWCTRCGYPRWLLRRNGRRNSPGSCAQTCWYLPG
jgi:hypothetical protein